MWWALFLMATDHKRRAEHWRSLESHAVARSVEATDEKTRTRLLSIAASYDKLAIEAETAAVLTSVHTKSDPDKPL
jgi:hypothetical protein